MKILAYKGKSLLSKLIRWQTRSVYSHLAVQLPGGDVIEAWHVGGVSRSPTCQALHKRGTEVDVFTVTGEYSPLEVNKFLHNQVGAKYDYKSIARFLTRRDSRADGAWFCSELVFAAFQAGGLNLLERIPASHVSPGICVTSPYLQQTGVIIT